MIIPLWYCNLCKYEWLNHDHFCGLRFPDRIQFHSQWLALSFWRKVTVQFLKQAQFLKKQLIKGGVWSIIKKKKWPIQFNVSFEDFLFRKLDDFVTTSEGEVLIIHNKIYNIFLKLNIIIRTKLIITLSNHFNLNFSKI